MWLRVDAAVRVEGPNSLGVWGILVRVGRTVTILPSSRQLRLPEVVHGLHGCDQRLLLVRGDGACGFVCAKAALLLPSREEVLR
jgi:hypothetical protein